MPPPTLIDTFRTLASFDPVRRSLKDAPWEEYVEWAIVQGLAPLAAYNLEYRLAGAGAPDWVRERLLSVHQGSLNDNVMKLVNFKRSVDALEGRQIVVLGGTSFAEALYPHVAFRPVLEVELLIRPADIEGFSRFLGESHFKPAPVPPDSRARAILDDTRTQILLYAELLGPQRKAEEDALFSRSLPMRVYGESLYRLDLEDALLVQCLQLARAGFEVPLLSYVDVRELLLGAPSMGGPYSRPCDPELLKARAKVWRIERAVFTALAIVERLFPETSPHVTAAKPPLRLATRQLLERLIISPVSELGQTRVRRGADRLRRLLAGGD